MFFSYKAKTKDGVIVEDVMESFDRFSLARELRSRGFIPVSISEKGANGFDFMLIFNKIFARVKNAELILLTKNLSGMLKAGLSLARALSVSEKQTKNKTLNTILGSVINEINSGGTFSSAISKFPKVFSSLFVSMVRAGEESGNLANSLTEIGSILDKTNSLNRKIKSALIYPGVILSAMVLIGILMFAFVVPTLASTFKELGVQMPFSTRIIIGLGNFFSEHLILSLVAVVVGIFGLIYIFRAHFLARYIDFMVIKLPVIGNLTKELNTARTTRTMSSLLISGVSITRAIEITEDVVQKKK